MTTWADLPPRIRTDAVRLLRSRLPLDDQDAIRHEIIGNPVDWSTKYPGWGTEVRELLRANVVADEDLPGLGWHDYWADAVQEAVSTMSGFA